MSQGLLFIIIAPSGAGKTSLVNQLVATTPSLSVSVSHTTRNKRASEINGENYFFVDESTFEKMVADDIFLEHATVFGLSYGTSKRWVEEQLAKGIDVILEIDWQGAHQVKEKIPSSIGIFILPPTPTSLAERLHKRGQDPIEAINRRLAEGRIEMQHAADFEYVVINEDFNKAAADLAAIIRATRLCARKFKQEKQAFLEGLLAG